MKFKKAAANLMKWWVTAPLVFMFWPGVFMVWLGAEIDPYDEWGLLCIYLGALILTAAWLSLLLGLVLR